MKKIITLILLCFSFTFCFSQPITQRTNGNNTINDPRQMHTINLFIPRYLDTLTIDKGIDTCGAIVYTYTGNKFWLRGCSPKHWIDISGGGGSGFTSADNGITNNTSTNVQWGGVLIKNTTIDSGGFFTNFNLSRIGITNAAPNAKLHLITDGITNSNQSDNNGILLQNTTAATVGNQKTSPPFIQSTQGWKLGAGSGSKTVRIMQDIVGVQSSLVGATWQMSMNYDGGTYAQIATIKGFSNSPLTTPGASGNITGGQMAIGTINGLQMWNVSTNMAVGISNLTSLTSGVQNTAFGQTALNNDTSGSYNTALGYASLINNISGSFNTAVGMNAMNQNTTGQQNAAFGYNALLSNTTAIKNVAIGPGALENTTTGGFNTFVGEDAGLHNTTGVQNAGIGWLSWSQNITGSDNIGIGQSSGRNVVNGDHNVALGDESMYLNFVGGNQQEDTVNNSIAIGAHSYTTASNQMRLGNDSLTSTYIYGLTHNNTTALTVVMIDTVTKRVYHIPQSSIVGATPTWEATVTAQGATAFASGHTVDFGATAQVWRFNTLVNDGLTLSSTSTASSGSDQTVLNVLLSGANANNNESTQAGYFQNTHTGTGSTNTSVQGVATSGTTNYGGFFSASGGTNSIAGYFTASGGGAINRAIEVAAGNVLLTPLTASQFVSLDASKNMTSSAVASSILAASLTDETGGTGVAMFNISPAVTTSITTASTTFALLNTTATTVNAFGAATATNLFASASGGLLNLKNTGNAAQLVFYEPSASGTNISTFKAVAQASDINYSLPATVGAAGTVLTDAAGNGVLSWASAGGGGWATTGTTIVTTPNIDGSGSTISIFSLNRGYIQSNGNVVSLGDPNGNNTGAVFVTDADNDKFTFDNTAHTALVGINTTPTVALDIVNNIGDPAINITYNSGTTTRLIKFTDGAGGSLTMRGTAFSDNYSLYITGADGTIMLNDGPNPALAGTGSRAVLVDADGVPSAPVSDYRVKQFIKPLDYGLATIMQLKPVSFEYIDGWKNRGEGKQIGFIAQDIASVLPNSAFINQHGKEKGYWGYEKNDLIPILTKAIQEQQVIIESLLLRIEKLEHK